MRLLHTTTFELSEHNDNEFIPYAILSHTWDVEEVTFQDMQHGHEKASKKAGWKKITAACRQARTAGWKYIWIDTCLIDKSSSAELSEAINSMFRYYRGSGVCIAHLSDVPPATAADFDAAFRTARWFTRGWTLQELLAPRDLEFYAADWSYIGAKADLVDVLARITGIERGFLRGGELALASVAKRMSWAAERITTRTEDQAYCLLGIFDVFMPLLYGEGRHAFRRLQEEIMRRIPDQSLLAYGFVPSWRNNDFPAHGFFARTPWAYSQSRSIVPYPQWPYNTSGEVYNKGVRIEGPVLEAKGIVDGTDILLAIGCHLEDNDRDMLCICLMHIHGDVWRRIFKTPVLISRELWIQRKPKVQTLFVQINNLENRLGWDDNKHSLEHTSVIFRLFPLSRRDCYFVSRTDPPNLYDSNFSRLILRQSKFVEKEDRTWNVCLYIADENGEECFCVRVSRKNNETFNMCTYSLHKAEGSATFTIKHDMSRYMCKIRDETFDFEAKFKSIWAGEITTIISLDLWSEKQLRNSIVRRIREFANEIRYTGHLDKPSTLARLVLPKTNSFNSTLSKSDGVEVGWKIWRRWST